MTKPKLASNTQIYLDCRKLLDIILDITPNFPKAYKFTVGNKMQYPHGYKWEEFIIPNKGFLLM